MTSSSNSSSNNQPVSGGAAAADDERVSALRVAIWVAIAIVLVTGVVLYFRHQNEAVPVLGAVGGAVSSR